MIAVLAGIILGYHALVIGVGLHYARRGVITVKRPAKLPAPKQAQP